MPLSLAHVEHVCNLDSMVNDTCRYLSEDGLNMGQYQCLKLTGQKKPIDEAVEDYLKTIQTSEQVPLGDNCKGYPVLRHALVGFDCEKKTG